MATTIVSWYIEGEESSQTIPPAIILNKPPTDITLGDIKRYYHGPRGVFLFKTLEQEEGEALFNSENANESEKYHWTVITDDIAQVPVGGAGGGIIIKVRPAKGDNRKTPKKRSGDSSPLYSDKRKKSGDEDLSPGSYVCTSPGCGKTFNKPWRLKSHQRNHTGEKKPHACTFEGCSKSFNESQALKNHIRVHTGEKPYVCDYEGCDKKFSEKGNLRKHQRIHTGLKPYVCAFEGCDKSFGRSDQLKVHIYEHTGIKPFACTWENCTKTFSYSSGLKVHMKSHETGGIIKNEDTPLEDIADGHDSQTDSQSDDKSSIPLATNITNITNPQSQEVTSNM